MEEIEDILDSCESYDSELDDSYNWENSAYGMSYNPAEKRESIKNEDYKYDQIFVNSPSK